MTERALKHRQRALLCLTAAIGFVLFGLLVGPRIDQSSSQYQTRLEQIEQYRLQPLTLQITTKRIWSNPASSTPAPRYEVGLASANGLQTSRALDHTLWQTLQTGDRLPYPAYQLDDRLFIPALDSPPSQQSLWRYVLLLAAPLLLLAALFHHLARRARR